MANFERPHACVPLANSGGQSNFSRSHERAPYINACKRHPSDAAVPFAFFDKVQRAKLRPPFQPLAASDPFESLSQDRRQSAVSPVSDIRMQRRSN